MPPRDNATLPRASFASSSSSSSTTTSSPLAPANTKQAPPLLLPFPLRPITANRRSMSLLFYRRPSYVERRPGYLDATDCQIYVDRTRNSRHRPPPELSLDNILANRTLPPCTLGDFMDYLVYVARDAENLQFYLWFRDYRRRFDALRPAEQALAPDWTFDPALLEEDGADGVGAANADHESAADTTTRSAAITFEKGVAAAAVPAAQDTQPPTSAPPAHKASALLTSHERGLYDKGFADPRTADAHYATIAAPPGRNAEPADVRGFIDRSISWQRHRAATKVAGAAGEPAPGHTCKLDAVLAAAQEQRVCAPG